MKKLFSPFEEISRNLIFIKSSAESTKVFLEKKPPKKISILARCGSSLVEKTMNCGTQLIFPD